MLEISRLIAEVKEKDDVRILPGDPAFALVTLNQLTLEDLASEFGVSRERVRQIEVRAFEKVQSAVKHTIATQEAAALEAAH